MVRKMKKIEGAVDRSVGPPPAHTPAEVTLRLNTQC